MKSGIFNIDGVSLPMYSVNTLVVGSGAAALNGAVCLVEHGQKDIAIVTDCWGGGTSNNAGSDKQTYYKLSLSGERPDSPREMAQDLFDGGCMHGDIALCEALHSAQAFFHLVRLGVPFPHDRYGAYVGYKTDHDPRGRGTSAGPLTSHLMFEALAKDVHSKGIPVFDRHEVIALLTEVKGNEKHVIGVVALDKDNLESEHIGFVVFNAVNVMLGTGGPAGIYKTSVYPESQTGSHGLAFRIGAVGHNLTEWQYGLASVKFRWNLSGTYQQVIPRYISTDRAGKDEREFLNDYFPDLGTLCTAIFLKGYQWPFDPGKVRNYGSSLIDLLVYHETAKKGRRVFLDFTQNPGVGGKKGTFSFDLLSEEAYGYLKKSGALQKTPIERLSKMNPPAIKLYKDHGIDITREPLKIAVCAQHNNGGLRGNIWWESNIKHLFPVGEANGSHGVHRPGGSSLNAGQVGSLRAAMFIAKRYDCQPPESEQFGVAAMEQIQNMYRDAKNMIHPNGTEKSFIEATRNEIQERMSVCGAHVRNADQVKKAVTEAWQLYFRMKKGMRLGSVKQLPEAFKNLDLCLTHALYLEAINEYLEKGGQSRGSYLVLSKDGERPCPELGDEWKFRLNGEKAIVDRKILEIFLDERGKVQKKWADIRPIPEQDLWFENVWNAFMRDEIID